MVDWRDKFSEASEAAREADNTKKQQEQERSARQAEADQVEREVRSEWPGFLTDLQAQTAAAFQLLEPPFLAINVRDASAEQYGYIQSAKIEILIDGRATPDILEMKCNRDGRVDCIGNSFKGRFVANFQIRIGDPSIYMGIVGDFLLFITKGRNN